MTLIELLLVRRYSIQSDSLTSYQTLIALVQTYEFMQVTRVFSRRRAVEILVEKLYDARSVIEPTNAGRD